MNYNFQTPKETPKKEYYSGSNAKVYFGDIWIDQLAGISFQLQEQVVPIYGFHSYTFDRVSRGNRLVSGSFVLNFSENGYLQTVLDSLASRMKSQGAIKTEREGTPFTHKDAQATIQTILKAEDSADYADYIDSLKSSFWGDTPQESLGRETLNKDQNQHFYGQRLNEEGYAESNPLKDNGFNILIDLSPEANYTELFDSLDHVEANGSLLNSQYTITGVHITGMSQRIGNDGNILQQEYTFIAKDLDGDISQGSLDNPITYDFAGVSSDTARHRSEALDPMDGIQRTY